MRTPDAADVTVDLLACALEVYAGFAEHRGGDAAPLGDAPEQNVLGPDHRVVEEPGFLLGQHQDPAGPVREALEHANRVPGLSARMQAPDAAGWAS